MWHELLNLPHPTFNEIAIAAEVYTILHMAIRLGSNLYKEEELIRRELIRRHVKFHTGRYAHCKCSTVRETVPVQPTQSGQVMVVSEYLFDPSYQPDTPKKV